MVSFDDVLPTLVRVCETWPQIVDAARIAAIRDLVGRVRLAIEEHEGKSVDIGVLEALLERELGRWFAKPIVTPTQGREKGALARVVFEQSAEWPDASFIDAGGARKSAMAGRWRRLERRLTKLDWLQEEAVEPPWALGAAASPAVVTFYSFKGGVGRTTLLVAFAAELARRGKKVAALDLDLEAPGLATVLGAEATRGVLDYIVDYVATGSAEAEFLPAQALGPDLATRVDVLPAGRLDAAYLEKLARLDFAASGGLAASRERPVEDAMRALLNSRRGKNYDFVLIDARAGLHDLAGLSLHGLAHVDVLVGRATEQGCVGLDVTVHALARRRTADAMLAVVVHAMVPADERDSRQERERFRQRSYEIFKRHVYDPSFEDPDIPAADDDDALHAPLPITRVARLEAYDTVASVLEQLQSAEHVAVAERIIELCAPEHEDQEGDAEGAG